MWFEYKNVKLVNKGNRLMSEEKSSNVFGRIFGFVFRNPINILCLSGIGYCAVQAYMLNNAPFMHKAAMLGIVGLWLFLFIAKNMLKLFVFLLIIGGLVYGWFYLTGKDQKACEDNGGFWNKNTLTCEEKVSWWQQVGKMLKSDNQ